MSTSPTEGPPPLKKTRGRWFKVRVVLAVAILLIGFTLYLNWRNALAPSVVGVLSTGHVYLDVPIMTMYTPSLAVPGFETRANVSFVATTAYATRLTFTWSAANGSSLPVRFVLTAGPANDWGSVFGPGPSDGFLFFPAGQPSGTITSSTFSLATVNPGDGALFSEIWRMDYVIREMSVHDWFGEDRWFEVGYSFSAVHGNVGPMPAANTTAPLSSDLVPLGTPIGFSYAAGYPWSYRWSIRGFSLPTGGFRHTVGPVDLDAGTAGTIHAVLASTFQWGPNDAYEIRAGGSGPANLSLQAYVDMRFGSLLVESTR